MSIQLTRHFFDGGEPDLYRRQFVSFCSHLGNNALSFIPAPWGTWPRQRPARDGS